MYIAKILIGILFCINILLFMPYSACAKDLSYTQVDRDRMIALIEGQKSLQKQVDNLKTDIGLLKIDTNRQIDTLRLEMNSRFENVDRQFGNVDRQLNDIKTFMLWGFGILFSMMCSLFGFVLWDRRSVLTPAIRRTDDIEEREKRLEAVLREVAGKDINVAEALRHAGIL